MEKRLFSMMVSGHCFMTIRILAGAFPALLKKGYALYNPVVAGRSPPRPPLAIIADKIVGLSYPKFALLATRGEILKAFIAEQRIILARKTYSLDTAWWHENYRVK